MPKLLLLYDTKERDLARDFRDFLDVLGVETTMIPLTPDRGDTLDEKERKLFEASEAALFLVTPGSERDGKKYPSPSVTDEMGRAKVRFKGKPESVIYLVDQSCSPPTTDQKAYIGFDRGDVRSVLEAVTRLVRDLAACGFYRAKVIPPRPTPGVVIADVAKKTSAQLVNICERMSEQPNGALNDGNFDWLLRVTLKLTVQDMNFVKRDLQRAGLVTYQPGYWLLTPIGWELVRHTLRERQEAARLQAQKNAAAFTASLSDLAKLIEKSQAQSQAKPKPQDRGDARQQIARIRSGVDPPKKGPA